MPIIEFFAAASEAGATDAALADVGTSALADTALADVGASALGGMGATGAELGGAGSGITQAQLASDTAMGGAGAGGADVNAAMVNAQQNAATQAANSGMTEAQRAYMQASNAGMGPGIAPGTVPLPATPASGIPTDLSANTGWGQTPVEPININPQTSGYGNVIDNGGMNAPQPTALERGYATAEKFVNDHPYISGYLGIKALGGFGQGQMNAPKQTPYEGPLNKYHLSPDFKGQWANPADYQYKAHYAAGGILDAAGGGPVEQMSNNAAIGANTQYPMSNMNTSAFAVPYQDPHQSSMVAPSGDVSVNQETGELNGQGTRLAAGGIASYKAGGNLSDTLDYYTNMMDGHNNRASLPSGKSDPMGGDVGIVHDTDPDTMYLDPMSAAQVRMAKINKRTNMQLPSMKRATPMGTINLRPQGIKGEASGSSLDPENAAQGGIMHASSHLGSYAAGGQPRLLKGPGDGMSDDIPATIANKQPARLADGEFVVPADVVSHLGNGSTDAGAKKLHGMMDNVRKARTGRKAQGKQIDPNRFLPK